MESQINAEPIATVASAGTRREMEPLGTSDEPEPTPRLEFKTDTSGPADGRDTGPGRGPDERPDRRSRDQS